MRPSRIANDSQVRRLSIVKITTFADITSGKPRQVASSISCFSHKSDSHTPDQIAIHITHAPLLKCVLRCSRAFSRLTTITFMLPFMLSVSGCRRSPWDCVRNSYDEGFNNTNGIRTKNIITIIYNHPHHHPQ